MEPSTIRSTLREAESVEPDLTELEARLSQRLLVHLDTLRDEYRRAEWCLRVAEEMDDRAEMDRAAVLMRAVCARIDRAERLVHRETLLEGADFARQTVTAGRQESVPEPALALEPESDPVPLARAALVALPSPDPSPKLEPRETQAVVAALEDVEGQASWAQEARPKVARRPASLVRGNERNLLQRELREFFQAEQVLLQECERDEPYRCKLKSIICRARYLLGKQQSCQDDSTAVKQSLDQLRGRLQECGETEFYGLNLTRTDKVESWQKADEAYGWLATAYQAEDWVERRPLSHSDRVWLLNGMAAVETNLARLMHDAFTGAADRQQLSLHEWLKDTKGERHIQYWKLHANGGPKNEAVREAARAFAIYFPEFRKKRERAELMQEAQARVERSIEDWESIDGQTDAHLQSLCEAVRSWLDVGGRPTEKAIAPRLAPHRHYLGPLSGKQGGRLLAHLDELLAKPAEVDPHSEVEPLTEDLEYETKLARVRAALAGKRMLFVGGQHREDARLAIEKGLGLALLEWPGSDPTDSPGDFEHAAQRADAVCLLVRFSRHAYQEVLAEARKQGKMTFTLPAGYGLRRVVHDMAAQLPSP